MLANQCTQLQCLVNLLGRHDITEEDLLDIVGLQAGPFESSCTSYQ